MKTQKHIPDTDIPCRACDGTRLNQRYKHECGACFGSGLSTAPWEQRRRGTIITIWDGEPAKLPPAATIDDEGKPTVRNGKTGRIHMVSWPNPDYQSQEK